MLETASEVVMQGARAHQTTIREATRMLECNDRAQMPTDLTTAVAETITALFDLHLQGVLEATMGEARIATMVAGEAVHAHRMAETCDTGAAALVPEK